MQGKLLSHIWPPAAGAPACSQLSGAPPSDCSWPSLARSQPKAPKDRIDLNPGFPHGGLSHSWVWKGRGSAAWKGKLLKDTWANVDLKLAVTVLVKQKEEEEETNKRNRKPHVWRGDWRVF